MSYDPNYYRETYVEQKNSSQPYQPGNYTPHGNQALTQSRHSPQPLYNTQSLAPYNPPRDDGSYLSPTEASYRSRHSSHHRRHSSRSRSRHRSTSRHRSRSRSRSRSVSRTRDIGTALLGAAGGGFLGHKYGKSTLGTVGGALAGAVGTHYAEKEFEKVKEKRRERRDRGESPDGKIVGGLLHPERLLSRSKSRHREEEGREERRERRRHRHSSGGSRSLSRGYYDDDRDGGKNYEYYEEERRYKR